MPDAKPRGGRRSVPAGRREARAKRGRTPRSFGDTGACAEPDRAARPEPNASTELPLIAWGEGRHAVLAARRRLWRRGTLAVLGVAALSLLAPWRPTPRLVWNASASAPIGLYRVRSGAAAGTGDMVVVWLPASARALADRRHYLPATVPAVKRIAATAGERVCARGDSLSIGARRVATRLVTDRRGRPLPWWRGCRILRPGEIFLLTRESPESFDGRYFGPSARSDVIGRATLLWSPSRTKAKP